MLENPPKTATLWRRLAGSGTTYSNPPPSRQTRKPLLVDAPADSNESTPPGLWLLQSALWTAHGTQGSQVMAAIEGSSAWPQPDAQLIDDEGYPVWTSRVAELDPDSLREQLIAAQTAQTVPVEPLVEEHLRALALACGPLDSLLERAIELMQPLTSMSDEDQRQAVSLRITFLLPQHWSEPERALALQYIKQIANAPVAGFKNRWLVDATVPGDANPLPTLFDTLALTLRRERHPAALWIVLATDSMLSPSRIAELEASGCLYKPGHHNSLMAGEGAAGVLLTGTGAPQSWTGDPAMRLYWAGGQRERSADTSAQPDTATLDTLNTAILRTAQREAVEPCSIVCDADHRKSRAFEINHWASQTYADIVAEEQCLQIGAGTGHLQAAVGQLQALALAHHLAQQQQRPALAVSVSDALMRTILMAMPEPDRSSAIGQAPAPSLGLVYT